MATTPDRSEPRGDTLPPYRLDWPAVVARLQGDEVRGLSAGDVHGRLEHHGRNELPADPPTPGWRRFLRQLRDPLTLLLLVATVVSGVTWWIERASPLPYEALTILAIVLLDAGLGLFQERRAEQAVAALQALSAPSARVRRDGQPLQVPTAEVVPGDLLLLEEGDSVPADARLVESISLRVAEASLTGESTPVTKDVAALPAEAGAADRANMVFAGTAVASGRGRAVVTATGPATELGRIAGSLRATAEVATPLQAELDRIGRLLGVAVTVIALVVGATTLALAPVRTLTTVVEVLLLSVSLAVAAVPEGLTAITTIVLSLGTQRMARRRVIVRRLAAVETLGSTTVICTDKTGTLTRNEMTVRAVVTASGAVALTGTGYDPEGWVERDGQPAADPAQLEEVARALAAGSLASNATLLQRDGRWTVQGDPTEGALVVAARKVGRAAEALQARFRRVGEAPFSSERKLMSTAHADREDAGRMVIFAKGAPDVLLARCTQERVGAGARPLDEARRRAILAGVERLGSAALRTLGVASRALAGAPAAPGDGARPTPPGGGAQAPAAPAGAAGEALEHDLVWLGLIGMLDPPRPEARAAVAEARRAGVRPVMITGDHPVTAAAIAAELGLAEAGARVLMGAELERMDEAALRRAVREVSVFARVAPDHKLRIVQALRANGEIVAMTGDGVNDAPALKAADIGVAMGRSGTDVAKGAADMVLADDDFASIVAAVEEGRAIFGNVQRFLRYLLSSNAGEVLVVFLGVVLAGTIGLAPEAGSAVVVPLLATQILWINLLTDSGPALALGVEPADHLVMLRPPRAPGSRVVSGPMWIDIALVGAIMAAGTLLVMDWGLPGGLLSGGPGAERGLVHARTMAFTTLVLFQLFNTFNARFETVTAFHAPLANRWLWGAVLLAAGLQVAVVHLPFLQRAFSTGPLSPGDWLLCLAVASSVLWLVELKKLGVRLARGGGGAAGAPRPAQASAAVGSPAQASVRSSVQSSSASRSSPMR